MQCPKLYDFQSMSKGQKRFDQSINFLGSDVVNKIIAFTLSVLGYPYDFISNTIGFSEPGLKTLIQDIYKNGIERFLDKRKNVTYPHLKKAPEEVKPGVEYIEHNEKDIVEFNLTGSISLRLRKDDSMGKKLLTFLFLDANLLKQVDGAKILKCKRLAVYQNYQKLKAIGTKGLLDNRQGQRKDYKFDSKIKGEIIREYLLSIFNNKIPTKTSVSERLRERFSKKYSERAVALHLKKLGLTDSKGELLSEILQHVNDRINSVEYLEFADKPLAAIYKRYLEPVKNFREGLSACCENNMDSNFFQLEEKIENLQSTLHSVILRAVIEEIQERVKCPNCGSNDIKEYSESKQKREPTILKTSLGGDLVLSEQLISDVKCNNCKGDFDLKKGVLKLSDQTHYTPLTQKKICSANRAGSYENAVKNLKELINLDINRNQARKISNHIGEYINKEFKQLYEEISEGLPSKIISQRHPLIEELKINEKYLDTSKYLIIFAIDGGRMQLFNWIPAGNEIPKAKKSLYWHENKVFRISILMKEMVKNCISQPE
jgi:hypothetical protein